jgi:hypothetical protein
MRWAGVATVLAVVAPALAAQQTARPDPPRAGTLEAEVHYATGGDAWFSTNKPAYVALFDVSRGGVSQLYPTFSGQATELSGTSVRVEMRSAAALPGVAAFGGSSLVTLNTPVGGANAAGWPHTLLLVASSMPLRVGNMWTSNVAINNDLVRTHQWNDLDTDAGIAAVVDLVRPLDGGAEIATDRVQLATPARYASSLAYDPTHTAVGYSCWDANRQFISPVPQLGASCVGLREFPAKGPRNAAVNALPPAGATDTARGVAFRTARASAAAVAAPTSAAPRISEQKHGDVQSISDPAEIRAFMERMKSRQAVEAAPAVGAERGHDRARDGMPSGTRSGRMNPRNADGSPAYGGAGATVPHSDQSREAGPRAAEPRPTTPATEHAPAAPRPATAASSVPRRASPAPVKQPNERY